MTLTPELAQQLKSIAYQLIAVATGESVAPTEPAVEYPRVVTVDGARFMVSAPLNPLWKPSQYGRMFGARMVLNEPSNAQPGQALRSPAGYPLVYGIGEPRILYGDSTFADDGKVAEYIAAVAESQAGQARRDAETGADFSGGKPAGEVEIKVEQG